jgi:hypothetical protein
MVWAAPDDTLAQVRDRLEEPTIENKWRAFVLVHSAEEGYAVAPVFELQPTVWQQGPPALKRRLRDLDLLQYQPGVEQEALDPDKAEQLADQLGGWLVVLHNARYVGLMPARKRSRRVHKRPSAAFDLFDELLADSALAQTEFVEATPSTTMAAIALALKSKSDPRNAWIIVTMDDDTFGVIDARELNRQLQQIDGDLWATPVQRVASFLRPAAGREYGAVGHNQAQKLAGEAGFLVLTTAGRPVGLLVSQVVRRSAGHPKPAALEGAVYDLFSVPQALLSDYPSQLPPEGEPRFVNLWFEESGRQVIERQQALFLGHSYEMALNVGRLGRQSIIDWSHTPGGPKAIVEPREAEAQLYVSVFSQDFEIQEPTQVLTLPRQANSDTLRFRVRPVRRTLGEGDQATLDVCLYYRCNLVQSFEVRVEVLLEGEKPRTETPQWAKLQAARIEKYPDLDQVAPKALNLTITKQADGAYQFTFTLMPEAVKEPQWQEIRLGCRVSLRREDLIHLITKARRQLYNIARSKAYQNSVTGEPLTFRRAMQALALLGRQLYSKLFELGGPDSSARMVAGWLQDNLAQGATIQVVDLARDFVFPWNLVYDSVPWDENGLLQRIDLEGFWGWRYQFELLTGDLMNTYQTSGLEIDTTDGLRVAVGLNDAIPHAQEQRNLFDTLSTNSAGRAEYTIMDTSPELTKFLQRGGQDIFYAFCHGYTERMATDIQISDDLISEFKAWVRSLPADELAALKDQESSLFNVGDSWLKLTFGRIPLTMMQYYAADRFDPAPLVFLNMCESAQVLPSLSGGFIPFFLQRGARGVIGTECAMTSTFAHPFAEAFFQRLLRGQAVGHILWELRREYLEQGNPLGLAYTQYCDADLRLDKGILTARQLEKAEDTTAQTLAQRVDELWLKSEGELFATLGINLQAIEAAQAHGNRATLAKAQCYDATFSAKDTEMGVLEDLEAFGQDWWNKLKPELYSLLCNRHDEHHDLLMDALLDGAKMLAIALAPTLVAQVSALPAVAIVVATIAAKLIAETGLETVCELWAEALAE